MEKISIIVPMYNVEKYILRCLESIAKQEYRDIEVLCIDDGSTDNTKDICQQFAEQDSRFKVYTIENGGASNARNYGLSLITGKWFAFVDADDWVSPMYLQTLYTNAIKHGCDVSACMFRRMSEYGLPAGEGAEEILFFSSPKECICNYIGPAPSMNGMLWNKLYNAEKYKDIRLDTSLKVNEDCIFTFDVLERCHRACLSGAELYYWFYREDSLCHSKANITDFSSAYVFKELLKRTEKFGDSLIESVLKRNFVNCAVDLIFASATLRKSEEAGKVKRQCMEWKKDIWHMLDVKKKCKYILTLHMSWLLNIVK